MKTNIFKKLIIVTLIIITVLPDLVITKSLARNDSTKDGEVNKDESVKIDTIFRTVKVEGNVYEFIDNRKLPVKSVDVGGITKTDKNGHYLVDEIGTQHLLFKFANIEDADEENEAPISHVLQYNGHDYAFYRLDAISSLLKIKHERPEAVNNDFFTFKSPVYNDYQDKDRKAEIDKAFEGNFYYNEVLEDGDEIKVSSNTSLFEALDILRESEKNTNHKYYNIEDFKNNATDLTEEKREDVAKRLEILSEKVYATMDIGTLTIQKRENPLLNIDFEKPVITKEPGYAKISMRYEKEEESSDIYEAQGNNTILDRYSYYIIKDYYKEEGAKENILMQPYETVEMFEFSDRMVRELLRDVDIAEDKAQKKRENSRAVTDAIKQIAENMTYDEKAILFCILIDEFYNNHTIEDGIEVGVEEIFGFSKYSKEWEELDSYATKNYRYGYYKTVTFKPKDAIIDHTEKTKKVILNVAKNIDIALQRKEPFVLYTISKATGLRIKLNTGKVLSQLERPFEDESDPLNQKVLLEVIDDEVAHGATIEAEYTIKVFNDSPCTCTHLELVDYMPQGFHYLPEAELISSHGKNSDYGWTNNDIDTLVEKGYLSEEVKEKFDGLDVATMYIDNEEKYQKGFFIPAGGKYQVKIVVSKVISSAEDIQTVIDNYVEILGYRGGVISDMNEDGSYGKYEARRMAVFTKALYPTMELARVDRVMGKDEKYGKYVGVYPGDFKDDYELTEYRIDTEELVTEGLDLSKNSNQVMIVPPTGAKDNSLSKIIINILNSILSMLIM